MISLTIVRLAEGPISKLKKSLSNPTSWDSDFNRDEEANKQELKKEVFIACRKF